MDSSSSCRFRTARISTNHLLLLGVTFAVFPALAWSNESPAVDDYLELSLQDLLSIEVTSASKRLQQIKDAAAAIFVITRDDIRRSGATSIPEALRMAPGLQVAQINANRWAISSRGFNSQFANKLLVLMDGRSVYVPSFAGVYWETFDYILDDIDRIEVIRGPGATLWGSNAVNGIINIITRPTEETEGGLIALGAGSERREHVELRYGHALGSSASGRVYFKFQETDDFHNRMTGDEAGDDWDSMQAGFRIDGSYGERDDWTVHGDVYDLDAAQFQRFAPLPVPPYGAERHDVYDAGGWNVLGRWNHAWTDDSSTALQVYFDHNHRQEPALDQSFDTLDIDIQHEMAIGDRHRLVAGFGYRYVRDKFDNSFGISINPDHWSQRLHNLFVQDEIALVHDRLFLTLGSKFEHNDYTGFEIQPSARMLWSMHESHTLWGAVSRAVRIPSRLETNGDIVFAVMPIAPPPVPPLEFGLEGNPRQDVEEVIAYEFGYRFHPHDAVSLDVATFFNDYDKLQSVDATASPLVQMFDNNLSAETYGVEISAEWRAWEWWRIQPNYTYLRVLAHADTPNATTFTENQLEGSSPRHHFSVRSAMELHDDWDFDIWFYHVSRLQDVTQTSPTDVSSYNSLNVRIAWRAIPGVEVSISGRNLTEPHHGEFSDETGGGLSHAERSVFGQIRWEW